MPKNFEDAEQLIKAIKYADEYGLGVEFLAMFLSFQNYSTETFNTDIGDALSEWDI